MWEKVFRRSLGLFLRKLEPLPAFPEEAREPDLLREAVGPDSAAAADQALRVAWKELQRARKAQARQVGRRAGAGPEGSTCAPSALPVLGRIRQRTLGELPFASRPAVAPPRRWASACCRPSRSTGAARC